MKEVWKHKNESTVLFASAPGATRPKLSKENRTRDFSALISI